MERFTISLDEELARAFDALIAEASVSRAAVRLCIGQPAMSHALARLPDTADRGPAGWVPHRIWDPLSALVSLRLGGPVRFFPAEHDILHGLAGRMTIDSALGCYNEINQTRRVAQHPLNPRLFLEDMLLRYARAFARSAAPAVRK